MTPTSEALWMPLYIDKYLGDTTHLTAEQHGAYLLLLMTAWKRGGSLPLDERQLQQIARLTPAAWRRHRDVLLDFFQEIDGAYSQKRLSQEHEKAARIIATKRENGKKGGRPKKNPSETDRFPESKPVGFDSVDASVNRSGNREPNRNETQSQLQIQKPPLSSAVDYCNSEPRESASAPADGRFAMFIGWEPGDEFDLQARYAGMHPEYPWRDDLPEFVLYRMASGEKLTHGMWRNKFIQQIRRNEARRAQAGNEPTPIPPDWEPDRTCSSALAEIGIGLDFQRQCLPEFLVFWRDTGEYRQSWNAEFIKHVQAQWQRRPPPSQPNAWHDLNDRTWAAGIRLADSPAEGAAQASPLGLEVKPCA